MKRILRVCFYVVIAGLVCVPQLLWAFAHNHDMAECDSNQPDSRCSTSQFPENFDDSGYLNQDQHAELPSCVSSPPPLVEYPLSLLPNYHYVANNSGLLYPTCTNTYFRFEDKFSFPASTDEKKANAGGSDALPQEGVREPDTKIEKKNPLAMFKEDVIRTMEAQRKEKESQNPPPTVAEAQDSVPITATTTITTESAIDTVNQNEVNDTNTKNTNNDVHSLEYEVASCSRRSEPKNLNLTFNFAAVDAGAKLLSHSPAMTKSSSILTSDDDRYLLVPCNEPSKFVVIQLSEDIIFATIEIANYEYYSSPIASFALYGSSIHPTDQWVHLGTFDAPDSQDRLFFTLADRDTAVRYIKLQWLSHHRDEYYCTLTHVRVYGRSVLEAFRSDLDDSAVEVGEFEKIASMVVKKREELESKKSFGLPTDVAKTTVNPDDVFRLSSLVESDFNFQSHIDAYVIPQDVTTFNLQPSISSTSPSEFWESRLQHLSKQAGAQSQANAEDVANAIDADYEDILEQYTPFEGAIHVRTSKPSTFAGVTSQLNALEPERLTNSEIASKAYSENADIKSAVDTADPSQSSAPVNGAKTKSSQSQSIFRILTNRLKELEIHQTLSTLYVSDLADRFAADIEKLHNELIETLGLLKRLQVHQHAKSLTLPKQNVNGNCFMSECHEMDLDIRIATLEDNQKLLFFFILIQTAFFFMVYASAKSKQLLSGIFRYSWKTIEFLYGILRYAILTLCCGAIVARNDRERKANPNSSIKKLIHIRSQSAAAFFPLQESTHPSAIIPKLEPSVVNPMNEHFGLPQVKLEKLDEHEKIDKRRRKKSRISTQLDSYLDKSPSPTVHFNPIQNKQEKNNQSNNANSNHAVHSSTNRQHMSNDNVSSSSRPLSSPLSSPSNSPQMLGYPNRLARSLSGTSYSLPPLATSNNSNTRRHSHATVHPPPPLNPKRMSSPTFSNNSSGSSVLRTQNSFSLLQT